MIQALLMILGTALAVGQTERSASGASTATRSGATRTPTSELRIDSGAIRGRALGDKKDVNAYKGIPYAAPPTGELRWKPPRPVGGWQSVRDCFDYGAACPQVIPALLGGIPEMAIRAPYSEDCLFLNVWAPAGQTTEKLPVLYWIHGGGFVMGAASQPLYDGEELARLGCVVVSINYRVGMFGFLAHPALSQESSEKVSGNYGLLDQIEGLRWVKRNIALFGGDPHRVTICGESAGGMSVLCLMVAPQAGGLFHAAVAQSPARMNLARLRNAYPGQETAEQAGQRIIAACGLGASADAGQLRRLDVKALVQAAPTEPGFGAPLRLKPLTLGAGPIVDGRLVPESPNALFAAGREHPVPMIVGNTRDEMSLMLLGKKMPGDVATFSKILSDEFGDLADSVRKAYPSSDAAQLRTTIIQLASDLSFISETREMARAHAAAGQKTFRYQFSRPTKKGFLQSLGAHHGAEVAFLFQRPALRDDKSEMAISRTMGRYWINFATRGNPNGTGLPVWPEYRREAEETADFADGVTVLNGPRNDQLDVAEKLLRTLSAHSAKDLDK